MRSHDIVLFGATGFTGRLVAQYLVLHRGSARLAFAGRSQGKLETLARSLGVSVPILVCDADDEASLAAVAESARVVCTTVGPYAKYGSKLVAACVRAGTDYCDLTGEVQWIRRMIDAHHDEARRTGARIVHTSGFDSIPSDLGVLLLQDHARALHGVPCRRVLFAIRKLRGGASGGSIASVLGLVEEATKDPDVRHVLADPYSLTPGSERGPDTGRPSGIHFERGLDAWTAPFVMGAVSERVVRRTNALSGYPYGRDFSYREVMAFPRGPRGVARAVGFTAALAGLFGVAAVGPLRRLLEQKVPQPGEGPSASSREKGHFEIELFGECPGGRTARVLVAAQGDPGYAATSRMLGESALSLAFDDRAGDGGILTPAVASGYRLMERLRRAGMRFETLS